MSKTKIGKLTVHYQNLQELKGLKQEIFDEEIYQFDSENSQPTIIDAGAHIGLATLYFKSHYPQAKITCFEPILESFQLLEENIYANGLFDVETINVALASHDSTISLHIDSSDSEWNSSASVRPQAWNGQQPTREIKVDARSLVPWLNQPIDLLKMDIEGAEWEVLQALAGQLTRVQQLIIECHPNSTHSPSELITWLEDRGYKTKQSIHQRELKLIRAKRATTAN